MKLKTFLSILLAILLLTPAGLNAAFPVVDIFNLHQAILRLHELESMYLQGRAQLLQVELQYELALNMARYIRDLPERYRAEFALWGPLAAPDTYGNTAGWVAAENGSALQTASGYLAATDPVRVFNPEQFHQLNARTQARLKSEYATVDLSDGVATNALSTIGSIRRHSIALQASIARLQADSTSSDPAMNTRAALLNKINVAGVLSLRSIQATNQLLALQAEQLAIRQKQRRDAMVRQLNDSIYFHQHFEQTMAKFENGMSRDLGNFSFYSRY